MNHWVFSLLACLLLQYCSGLPNGQDLEPDARDNEHIRRFRSIDVEKNELSNGKKVSPLNNGRPDEKRSRQEHLATNEHLSQDRDHNVENEEQRSGMQGIWQPGGAPTATLQEGYGRQIDPSRPRRARQAGRKKGFVAWKNTEGVALPHPEADAEERSETDATDLQSPDDDPEPAKRMKFFKEKAYLLPTDCPYLRSGTVKVTCYDMNGNVKECHNPNYVGHSAYLECKKGYLTPRNVDYTNITCLHTNKWSNPLFQCIPVDPVGLGYAAVSDNHYMKFYNVRKNWQEASRRCDRDGARLVVADGEPEREFLRQVMVYMEKEPRQEPAGNKQRGNGRHAKPPPDFDGVYVGVGDRGNDGYILTIYGEPALGWCPSRPVDTPMVPDCGVLQVRTHCIMDTICSNKFPFVCEMDLTAEFLPLRGR